MTCCPVLPLISVRVVDIGNVEVFPEIAAALEHAEKLGRLPAVAVTGATHEPSQASRLGRPGECPTIAGDAR